MYNHVDNACNMHCNDVANMYRVFLFQAVVSPWAAIKASSSYHTFPGNMGETMFSTQTGLTGKAATFVQHVQKGPTRQHMQPNSKLQATVKTH